METSASLPLMAVMEIQRTLGSLTRAVDNLRQSQDAMQKKLSEVSQQVRTARTVSWVVGVILMALLAFVGWLVNNGIALLPSFLPKGP